MRRLVFLLGTLYFGIVGAGAESNRTACPVPSLTGATVENPAGTPEISIAKINPSAGTPADRSLNRDVGVSNFIAPALSMIAPKKGPSLSGPYVLPREVGMAEARRIWKNKLREADEKGFAWGHAIAQSGMLLAMSEAYRLGDQPETRAQLRGPFFHDWLESVRGLHGWGDTDSWLANYVGHPFEGCIAGYIQIQNDPRGRLQEFGKSRAYWKSRLKAVGWAFAYSTMYELSPIGDAGIGNVGHRTYNPGTKGYVDLVITPTLGLSLLVLEDMIDQKIVWPIEKRTNNKMVKRLLRSFLGMHRSFTNLFRFKLPWYIDSRGPVNQPAIRYSQLPY